MTKTEEIKDILEFIYAQYILNKEIKTEELPHARGHLSRNGRSEEIGDTTVPWWCTKISAIKWEAVEWFLVLIYKSEFQQIYCKLSFENIINDRR